MLKLTLCIVIVLCSTLVGFSYSLSLHKRKKVLESFMLELKNTKTLIRYSSKNLSQIFEHSFTGYDFSEDKPFYPQWKSMLCEYSKLLTNTDVEVLENLGRTLGTSDLSGELSNIDMYLTLLNAQIADAQHVIDSKSGVYRALGLSLGLAIAIILI